MQLSCLSESDNVSDIIPLVCNVFFQVNKATGASSNSPSRPESLSFLKGITMMKVETIRGYFVRANLVNVIPDAVGRS